MATTNEATRQAAIGFASNVAPAVKILVDVYTDTVIDGLSDDAALSVMGGRGRVIRDAAISAGFDPDTACDFACMVMDLAIRAIKEMPKDESAKLIAYRLSARAAE
jgi:hypothetical protein